MCQIDTFRGKIKGKSIRTCFKNGNKTNLAIDLR